MAWKRSKRIDEMHSLYLEGNSLESVASVFGVSRQSVYELFKNNGKAMRGKKKPLPFVLFNLNRYTLRNTGYYGRTNKNRDLLHRDVWEFYKGTIPNGFDIHHINGNKEDNRIENLECLSKSEHTKKYSPHNNQYTKGKRPRK